MASGSTGSFAGTEAHPLPAKIGEIGYAQGAETRIETEPRIDEPELPARHPADRLSLNGIPSVHAATSSTAPLPELSPGSQHVTPASKLNSRGIRDKRIFGGFRLGSFVAFVLQVFSFLAIAASWGIAATTLSKSKSLLANAALFFHIAFAMLCIVQLVFIERRMYGLRVERYTFLHPEDVLPSDRNRAPILAFNPWNRPPLPTYAAAVAQSGVRTGDVEDHLIVAPPPPAYGHTRGSRLLLSGFVRDSMVAQRPFSQHSLMSQNQEPSERPLSSISQDEQE